MSEETWTEAELLDGLDLAPAFLGELKRLGLLRVVAQDGKGAPLYSADARQELEKVLGLVELGYEAKDIAAIAKRVGLPDARRGLFRRRPRCVRLSELAIRSGVTLDEARRWIERGGVMPSLISDGGEALYGPEAIESVRRLSQLATLGLGEEAITDWLPIMAALDGADGERAREGLGDLAEVEARIDDLDQHIRALRTASRAWEKRLSLWRRLLKRLRRENAPGKKRRGRRRRVRTASRGRKGPAESD